MWHAYLLYSQPLSVESSKRSARRSCASGAKRGRLNSWAVTLAAVLTSMMVLMLAGCGGLGKNEIVLHPTADMLILSAKGKHLKVAAEDAQGTLRVYGWVNTAELKGYTLTVYDWGVEPEQVVQPPELE